MALISIVVIILINNSSRRGISGASGTPEAPFFLNGKYSTCLYKPDWLKAGIGLVNFTIRLGSGAKSLTWHAKSLTWRTQVWVILPQAWVNFTKGLVSSTLIWVAGAQRLGSFTPSLGEFYQRFASANLPFG
jgi:hypothetical protein